MEIENLSRRRSQQRGEHGPEASLKTRFRDPWDISLDLDAHYFFILYIDRFRSIV